MKNAQEWGWLTAGVLALGLNGIYHDSGAASWAHRAVGVAVARIEQRTAPVLALATGHTEAFFSRASSSVSRGDAVSCAFSSKVAHYQAKAASLHGGYARLQAMSARREAEVARRQAALARVEVNQARLEARMEGLQIDPVDVNVDMPEVPAIHVHIPRVSVADGSFTRCSW